jgi:hypothetical protein
MSSRTLQDKASAVSDMCTGLFPMTVLLVLLLLLLLLLLLQDVIRTGSVIDPLLY